MVKTILKWLLLIVLLGYAVAATVWAHGEARKNACSGIDIEITQTNSVDSVTRRGVLAEISRYKGKIVGEQLSAIDTRKIEQYLKQHPQFEDVVCNFTTTGRLHMKVTPMIPELRVFDDSVSYYINKDGKKMMSKSSFFVDVPVVSGKFNDNFSAADILPVTRFIATDPVLGPLVGMVHAEDEDNILLIPRIHGHVINFGDTTRLEEKKRALVAVYRKVMPYKGWNEYDTISVKFRGQVVATRRNKMREETPNLNFEEPDMEEATLPEIDYTENPN